MSPPFAISSSFSTQSIASNSGHVNLGIKSGTPSSKSPQFILCSSGTFVAPVRACSIVSICLGMISRCTNVAQSAMGPSDPVASSTFTIGTKFCPPALFSFLSRAIPAAQKSGYRDDPSASTATLVLDSRPGGISVLANCCALLGNSPRLNVEQKAMMCVMALVSTIPMPATLSRFLTVGFSSRRAVAIRFAAASAVPVSEPYIIRIWGSLMSSSSSTSRVWQDTFRISPPSSSSVSGLSVTIQCSQQ
mmetsp:Transcript_17502/g.51043  ORF Transcript_17502/g.51043 Transcript_17502/m.51043 type:complete len:248 (+) Transcript_17502:1470-2213(+)